MSSNGEVCFNVNGGGYWVKNSKGDIAYLHGEVKSMECKPEDILMKLSSELSEGLYGQKLWYKMPYEDNNDRKILCDGDSSFRKMCETAKWTGVVDVFLVNSIEHSNDVEFCEQHEEDLRVERNVVDFEDEDVDFDYHNTPPNSDGEDNDDFVRCKRGSGELKLSQVFDSLEEFKEALVDYVLKEGWNIKLCRWGTEKSAAKCGIEDGCPWHIYCSYEEHIGKWMVKVYKDQHSCLKDGYSKILKTCVIAQLFLDDIRANPEFRPKAMQQQLHQRFDLMTSIDKCRKAKEKTLSIIAKEHEEQFSRLKDYRSELLNSNRGSTVELDTYIDDGGSEIFQRFYVCFNVLRKLWSTWCRPIFGLDGCFLKCKLKGQLLAAVGRDANNQMYPFAWAVVDVENEDNWTWFIRKLKIDFKLEDGNGFTIISDTQKGLLNAVERELPKVEHRMCARHIYANLKKIFPSQYDMKRLFWQLAESYTMHEYNANLEAIKGYDIRLYEAIMEKNPKNCSLAFFTPSSSCIDVHNNISESFNNAIDPARYMPVVEMLETIRRRTMVRIDVRKKKALEHTGRFTLKATEFVEFEQRKVKFCKMVPGSDGRFEILESGKSFSLNMRLKSCACRRWEMSGIPCRHALRVILERKLNPEDYISNWYLTSRQQQIYSDSIQPVNGVTFWPNSGSVILPPPSLIEQIENRKGRKPKPKRKKGKNESPSKKKVKVSRVKRIMHCGRCGFTGHNTRKCKNIGVEISRQKKRLQEY